MSACKLKHREQELLKILLSAKHRGQTKLDFCKFQLEKRPVSSPRFFEICVVLVKNFCFHFLFQVKWFICDAFFAGESGARAASTP
jgi:hypothetical protein